MANLSVRRLDDETLRALRVRAAQHGVSMEEEARRILRSSLRPHTGLGDLAVEVFGGNYGEEPFTPPERESDPPPVFE